MQNIFLILPFLLSIACVQQDQEPEIDETKDLAKVISVTVSGDENDYRFNVEVESPDTGCDQYADWWEVIDESGNLIYRRILAHSHVTEQPFKRLGGSVPIAADKVVYVRAHMNNNGYGIKVMKGSISSGFEKTELAKDFAEELAMQNPLPESCAF